MARVIQNLNDIVDAGTVSNSFPTVIDQPQYGGGNFQQAGGQPLISNNLVMPQMDQVIFSPQGRMGANVYPLPDSVTIGIQSEVGVGAVPTVVNILNNDIFGFVTDNGSGAASIDYTFQDGVNGLVLSNLLRNARAGMGAIAFAVAIRMNVIASGAGDPAGLATANPFFSTSNAFGRSLPLDLNSTAGQTRGDFDTSIMLWSVIQNISAVTQLGLTMPVGDAATVTIYFRNNV